MSLTRAVSVAVVWSILVGVLGLAASVGAGILPPLTGGWGPVFAVLTGALGVAAALLGAARGRELEHERTRFTSDPGATRDEIRLAHQEAQRRQRLAHTACAAAALLTAYWLAYELPAASAWRRGLPVVPLLSWGLTMLLLSRRPPSDPPPPA